MEKEKTPRVELEGKITIESLIQINGYTEKDAITTLQFIHEFMTDARF